MPNKKSKTISPEIIREIQLLDALKPFVVAFEKWRRLPDPTGSSPYKYLTYQDFERATEVFNAKQKS